jgi:23S rRNA pseudouridine1911/1915/1917 synthase
VTDKFRATKPSALLVFLNKRLKGWSKKNIKQRLQSGCVVVNGKATTQFDMRLDINDIIEIMPKGSGRSVKREKGLLEVLFSDDDIVVVNKPCGLLSVASSSEKSKHVLEMLRQQLSTKRKQVKLWPAHRLDRETSGVLLFATSRATRDRISDAWSKAEKTYLAIVEGQLDPPKGTINQPLRQDENGFRAHVGEHADAKRAITHFKTIGSFPKNSLVEVKLETGRQHQIRAHMQWLGNPIVGDRRYGSPGRRLGLHALRLELEHPSSGQRLFFEALPPSEFEQLLR